MSATVRTLLENAMYLSIADREFSPIEPNGSQINVAANRLCALLDVYQNQIPYWETKTFKLSELNDFKASQVNDVDYILGGVKYPLTQMTQREFSQYDSVIDLESIPSQFWHDKANGALVIYPIPNQLSNEVEIAYKPLIETTTLDCALPNAIVPYMQLFLEYELALGLSHIYNRPWTSSKEQIRQQYYKKLIANADNTPSRPHKAQLKKSGYNTPWFAYLSGNFPGGN